MKFDYDEVDNYSESDDDVTANLHEVFCNAMTLQWVIDYPHNMYNLNTTYYT